MGSAWSEIRKLAVEVRELESALVGAGSGPVRTNVTASIAAVTKSMRDDITTCKPLAGGWVDRDNSIVVLVAELGSYDGLPCTYDFRVELEAGQNQYVVESIFENRLIAKKVSKSGGSIS